MPDTEIYFVYRSHYEGPLSKRVRKLTAPSIATWFGRRLQRAKREPNVIDDVERELGGSVYGLYSLFEAAKSQSLSADTGAERRGRRRKDRRRVSRRDAHSCPRESAMRAQLAHGFAAHARRAGRFYRCQPSASVATR